MTVDDLFRPISPHFPPSAPASSALATRRRNLHEALPVFGETRLVVRLAARHPIAFGAQIVE